MVKTLLGVYFMLACQYKEAETRGKIILFHLVFTSTNAFYSFMKITSIFFFSLRNLTLFQVDTVSTTHTSYSNTVYLRKKHIYAHAFHVCKSS